MKAFLSRTCIALVLGASLSIARPATALTFNLVDGPGLVTLQGSNLALYNQVRGGFDDAAALWSNLFADPVTVNYTIDFAALGPGILAQANSTQANYNYANVRNALIADQTTADDATATANLQAGPAISMRLNRTANSPNGAGSAVPFLDNDGDANNTSLRLTNANAKAIGLLAGNAAGTDATLTFSSGFTFDFDPSNGIAGGSFDFVGIAVHEIGHALGFVSGVDILDINSPPVNGPFNDNQFTFVSVLDLYRYSAASIQLGAGVIDWTANSEDKYFSIDGGVTPIVLFSEGSNFGDGQQASHWKDSLGIGILDPTAAPGELLAISANDRQALDVIGWTQAVQGGSAAPEPATLLLMGIFAPATLALRRKR